MLAIQIIEFGLGVLIVGYTLISAVRVFVLPRSASDTIGNGVFVCVRWFFNTINRRISSYERRDGIMALFSPISLLALEATWLLLILLGYLLMYCGLSNHTLSEGFFFSGSSLLTLGFVAAKGPIEAALAFTEAAIGLLLVALLISYLPTMYAAFSRREALVTLLAVRAGEPPFAPELLSRYTRIQGLEHLGTLWASWEIWFAELEESHTSLVPLVFFRSPQADHSWVTAAGTILDAAALRAAALDLPRDPQAELTIRAGYLALQRIADYFGIRYPSQPQYPTTPISIDKNEFLAACRLMAASGVPLKHDLDQAWLDYAGWRVNYDRVLLALALLTMAPLAPWTSDRTLPNQRPPRRSTWGRHPKVVD